MIHPDGSGLKRITEHGDFCGSPKWSGRQPARDRLLHDAPSRRSTIAAPSPMPGDDTRLVSIDIATRRGGRRAGGARRQDSTRRSCRRTRSATSARTRPTAGIYYASGKRGPKGDVRGASWSPDGTRVVFHKRLAGAADDVAARRSAAMPEYELTLTRHPAVVQPARRSLRGDRTAARRPSSSGRSVAVARHRHRHVQGDLPGPTRNVLAPQWSPRGDQIIFGVGHLRRVLQRLPRSVPRSRAIASKAARRSR